MNVTEIQKILYLCHGLSINKYNIINIMDVSASKYISHLKQDNDGNWIFQSNEEHQKGVGI